MSDLFKKFWYLIREVCKAEKEEEPAAAKKQQQDDDKQYDTVAIRKTCKRIQYRKGREMCKMLCNWYGLYRM